MPQEITAVQTGDSIAHYEIGKTKEAMPRRPWYGQFSKCMGTESSNWTMDWWNWEIAGASFRH
jgi:hypothetical protein